MILINLLPGEFREREPAYARTGLKPVHLRLAGAIFLGLTLILYVHYLISLKTLSGLKSGWASIYQDVQRVTQIRTGMDGGVRVESKFLKDYIRVSFPTTRILSAVSESLPDTVWLIELKVTRTPKENSLLLKGLSHPSRGHSSIHEIEKYLRELKNGFPPGTDLMLTTSRQQRDQTELTLFTAVFKWLQSN